MASVKWDATKGRFTIIPETLKVGDVVRWVDPFTPAEIAERWENWAELNTAARVKQINRSHADNSFQDIYVEVEILEGRLKGQSWAWSCKSCELVGVPESIEDYYHKRSKRSKILLKRLVGE